MATSKFGIVLLPDITTEGYVKKLAAEQPNNNLAPEFHVHLSLLHVVLERSRLPVVCKLIDNLPISKPFPIECHGILEQNGWHFLETQKSPTLTRVQKKILPIARLRDGNTNFSWRTAATIEQKQAYGQYGYPNIGAAWSPHFTFGVTEPKKNKSTPLPQNWHGNIRAIALGVIGDHGAVTKLLYVRKLFF